MCVIWFNTEEERQRLEVVPEIRVDIQMPTIALAWKEIADFRVNFTFGPDYITIIDRTRLGLKIGKGEQKIEAYFPFQIYGVFRRDKRYKTFSYCDSLMHPEDRVFVFKWDEDKKLYKLVDVEIDDETWYISVETIDCDKPTNMPLIKEIDRKNAVKLFESRIDTAHVVIYALKAIPGNYIVLQKYNPEATDLNPNYYHTIIQYIGNDRVKRIEKINFGCGAEYILRYVGLKNWEEDLI